MRINPYHPEWYWVDLGSVFYIARRYNDAIEAFKQKRQPETWVLSRLAACYAQLGRMEEAAQAAAEIMRLTPGFSISRLRSASWGPEDLEHFRDGMRKAGLPD